MFSGILHPWQPDRDFLVAPLHTSLRHRLRLDRFPAGIDHKHIDVSIAAELLSAGNALVKAALREEVHRNFWREPLKNEDREVEGLFASTYIELSRATIRAARAEARLEKVQLFQVAVLKHLFACIDQEMGRLRDELESAQVRYTAHQNRRYLELQERLTVLIRARDSIRYRTCRRVIRVLMRLERGPIRKSRKAILGRSWPISAERLFNPLLQFEDHFRFTDFMQVYPPLLHDQARFVEVNGVMLRLLAPWLPDAVSPEGLETAAASRADSGAGSGSVDLRRRAELSLTPEEREREVECWLSMPRNLALLLGGTESNWPNAGPWRHPKWGRFQLRLVARLEQALEQEGLLRPVFVSMRFNRFFRSLGLAAHARNLFALTCAETRRRELVNRLAALSGMHDPVEIARRVENERKAIRRLDRSERGHLLAGFGQQFAIFRRDLKLALDMRAAIDRVQIRSDRSDREMSRSNGLLQVFGLNPSEAGDKDRRVVGHVIVKADVRGSTAITTSMREKNQNPAAYFSRNLFDPITSMLPEFGAEKVFVEGDAVILMIPEYEREQGGGQVIARACGLTGRILHDLDQRNADSRRLGLPLLELGLGVAYVHESPTYLYDHGHRIVISPAINHADRLSSCNRRLRAFNSARSRRTRGVSVVARVGAEVPRMIDDDDLMRCNVNGVELDSQAFRKLAAEVALKETDVRLADDTQGTRYFIGQCADKSGRFHQIVVREAIVPVWLGNQLVVREQAGRRFFELVTETAQLKQIFEGLDDVFAESELQSPHQLC